MSDKRRRQVARLFDEAKDLDKDVLGGKGFGLVKMTNAGLPVPPGFIVESGVCRAYWQEGGILPKRLGWQLRRSIALLERETGKKFGGKENPLLISVRSGAKVSMPGMMDTILNLGLTDESLQGLIDESGDEYFAYDTYRHFLEALGKTVLGISSEIFVYYQGIFLSDDLKTARKELMKIDVLKLYCKAIKGLIASRNAEILKNPWGQLKASIEAVCESWKSPRAVEYRKSQGIAGKDGTAIVVQTMVFGNYPGDSGTGVVFSRNVKTGQPGLYGEYLANAQGEDLVAGIRTPTPISSLAQTSPRLFGELQAAVQKLELDFHDVVDVEFTIELGRLHILQVRTAKRTAIAAIRIAVDMVSEGRWTKKEALANVPTDALDKMNMSKFDPMFTRDWRIAARGLPASGGLAVGVVAFSSARAIELAKCGNSVVLCREDTSPDDFSAMLVSAAIVTKNGGETCHAAVVARSLNKPAIVGAKNWSMLEYGIVSVDGTNGIVYGGSIPIRREEQDQWVQTFATWVSEIKPKPTLDSSVVGIKWSVNTMLIDFYLLEALAKATKGTTLEEKAAGLFRKTRQMTSKVFGTYLWIAVTREIRYAFEKVETLTEAEKQRLLGNGLRPDIGEHETTKVATDNVVKLTSLQQVEFVDLCIGIFAKPWSSPAYGGEKWRVIAETLGMYLKGRIGDAVFIDRVFDLRHNGGCLFNKHPMVTTMTDEDELPTMLEYKKKAANIEELYAGITRYKTPTKEVSLLFQEWKSRSK